MKYILKSTIKYTLLALVACVGAVAIYYYVVPKEDRIPIGIEVK